ncbi:MAG: hypothetical protein JW704_06025, partial [Anaerolineaceae bacterium]|nr:hypothetical protein [Anaerolineaceae bacterium]
MNQRNLTLPAGDGSGSSKNCWIKLDIRRFRPGRKFWQRAFTALWLFSFLLSPLGPVHAQEPAQFPIPEPIGPANNSTMTISEAPPLGNPEISWAAVPDAGKYRLQISNTIGFNTPAVNIVTTNTTYTHISTGLFVDGEWFWRVRAEAQGTTAASDYSEPWKFIKQWASEDNKPTLLSPADGATIDFYDAPAFSWTPVMGAAEYNLQVSLDPDFPSLVVNVTTLATTHQPIAKLTNNVHYWRVIPIDTAAHDGTPSDVRSFTPAYNFIPTLLEPEDDAEPTFTPTFRWTAVRGAQYYKLQYSTDPFFSEGVTTVDSRNTSYTPTDTLPNDVNCYWRVRTHSGNSVSGWSETRSFFKQWYIQPVHLTPTNGYQEQRWPLFSWTPVPGAAYYYIEIDDENPISPYPTEQIDNGYVANPFYTLRKYTEIGDNMMYFQVTPFDASGKEGLTSVPTSFRNFYDNVTPHQIYPLYYYPPNTFPPPYNTVTMNPYEDRTVALPIFLWHRVDTPAPSGEVFTENYRLQVSTVATFVHVDWSVDTENTSAAPTAAAFNPLADIDYYWRVCALATGCDDALEWSQIWRTRIDTSRGLAPTTRSAPDLIRPENGEEFVESTPLMQWFPLSGAATYDVEISQDADFSSTVDTATVDYPAYVPTDNLAQRISGDIDFGVYYWRVKDSASGTWSEARRFQIAAQSEWQKTCALGDAAGMQIGSDESGDSGLTHPEYDVTSLFSTKDEENWYFRFAYPDYVDTNVTYGLYLDLDHTEGSGATLDPEGYNLTTISAFRPEYAIYILQESGAFSDERVFIYHWLGGWWDTVLVLRTVGGQITYGDNYFEFSIPATLIGFNVETGSYALSLVSLPASGGGDPQDSVPTDPNIPDGTQISRFSNVSERMNVIYPPNDAGTDPSVFSTIQPFYFDYPIHANWSGHIVKAYLDPQLTTEVASYTHQTNLSYWAQSSHSWEDDFNGDNTYYWRVQPDYNPSKSNVDAGPWSKAWRFERKGLIPQNLQTSVTFATPTFSWDMVEGAEDYTLWVDDDPEFNSRLITVETAMTSYTHPSTIPNGTYYWKVNAQRHGGVTNSWSETLTFTLALPTPGSLNHQPAGIVGRAPTLCWDPLIVNDTGGDPVLAAWKYRIQVSKDSTFSSIFDSADTEQSCWTPIKGYDDGQYYWHVAMIDGNSRIGAYSPTATFTKQYPITTLLSPEGGAVILETPTFVWSPVNGAAHYRLEISTYANFSKIHQTVTTDNTRYTPVTDYNITKTYYWRVAILDDDNKIGPFTDART